MSKFEKFLRNGDRLLIIDHLSRLRKPENIALALQHYSAAVRIEAVEALGNLGPRAAPFVKDIIKHALERGVYPLEYVQLSAVSALGKIGSPEALPALRKIHKKFLYQEQQDMVVEAIRKIENK
ncbi:MAG TPA: HEAT repeat domain-containing protein [Candidatus Norongarragalinales archaeon]|nr:HEAT repeat domain-containing protein [Candidatus Norongarragalinales archaeon]